jgi:butyryl-CoA dehydrogenase
MQDLDLQTLDLPALDPSFASAGRAEPMTMSRAPEPHRFTLLDDDNVEFLLHDVFDLAGLCQLCSSQRFDPAACSTLLSGTARFARQVLQPTHALLDAAPPSFDGARVRVHRKFHEVWPRLFELGVGANAEQAPRLVTLLASAYLWAGHPALYALYALTTGVARLIETYAPPELRAVVCERLWSGAWSGTMAITEAGAGSSVGDIATRALPDADGHRISGTKLLVSGGDQDAVENIVHLVLARRAGAPAGTRGLSLFVVPKLRPDANGLLGNDVKTGALYEKLGFRAAPNVSLAFGEDGDCRGSLLGAPERGIRHMFELMNAARLSVANCAAALASAAYLDALAYARARTQGRPPGASADAPPVPLVAHADVRRMLLRQKSIAEGSLALTCAVARYVDLARYAVEDATRRDADRLARFLTPVAKGFCAERGFESNDLALQVHGGYGYLTDYSAARYLRDQRLNGLHEGTTGIMGLDLLVRQVAGDEARAVKLLGAEVARAVRAAGAADAELGRRVQHAMSLLEVTTGVLCERRDEHLLLHSADYLELVGTVALAWLWLWQVNAVRACAGSGELDAFGLGKLSAARYWIFTELPRVEHWSELCRRGEDSYRSIPDAGF